MVIFILWYFQTPRYQFLVECQEEIVYTLIISLKDQLEIKSAAEPDKSCMHLIHNKIIFSGWIPVLALVFCHDCHAQSFLAELVHLSLV